MSSVILSIGLVIGTVVVLVALFFKKDEAPTNYILLFAFVSVDWYMCMHGQNRCMMIVTRFQCVCIELSLESIAYPPPS